MSLLEQIIGANNRQSGVFLQPPIRNRLGINRRRIRTCRCDQCIPINSQPWGIVHWLVFKRLPVQTTYLFLQAFLKYFYSQEMLTTSEIKFKLHNNINIISPITNDYDVLWRKLWSKWVELIGVKRCTCLFTNTLKMITRRITILDIVPPQELSSILHFLNIFQSNKLR